MSSTIQVRTDPAAKKAVQAILKRLGMDLSTAINVYLHKIIEKKGIPFEVVTENGLTPRQEKKILAELASARRSKKSYASAQELHEAILGKWKYKRATASNTARSIKKTSSDC